jgi:hypothetical protein
MHRLYWPLWGVLLWASLAMAQGNDPLAALCASFDGFDENRDGVVEIARLEPLATPPSSPPAPAARLLLVLVEARLLEPLPGAVVAPDLRAALDRYLSDLAGEGWQPRLIAATVYAGERHQDGRTLLALRRFFQRVRELDPSLAGAVLVGAFPEAFLVRNYAWRDLREPVLNEGTPHEKRFANPVPCLRVVPEPVAWRCELVLCDLDGRWEDLYVEPRERLPAVLGVFPDGVPPRGGRCTDFERSTVTFEDFFYVNDGRCDVREVRALRSDGQPGDQVVALDIEPLADSENAECAAADRALPNPLARPDIIVSRLNPRGIALRPRPDVKGLDGEGLLDAQGRPQTVRFADEPSVPHWLRGVWEADPALERRLLAEYLDRNHQFRTRPATAPVAAATIGFGLGDGAELLRRCLPTVVLRPAGLGGGQATLLDLVRWLQAPAELRDLRAHSDPWGSSFDKPDLAALTDAAGKQPWSWSKVGTTLTPSLQDACAGGKADLALYRTLWANGALPASPCFYYHTGCEAIAPDHAADRPYNHPEYGFWQGGEALLFYAQGLALVGRAKVFYDEPRGVYEALAEGRTFGAGWARYFDNESAARDVEEVGGGIGRKRSYFWSVLGDWTLRLLRPP